MADVPPLPHDFIVWLLHHHNYVIQNPEISFYANHLILFCFLKSIVNKITETSNKVKAGIVFSKYDKDKNISLTDIAIRNIDTIGRIA